MTLKVRAYSCFYPSLISELKLNRPCILRSILYPFKSIWECWSLETLFVEAHYRSEFDLPSKWWRVLLKSVHPTQDRAPRTQGASSPPPLISFWNRSQLYLTSLWSVCEAQFICSCPKRSNLEHGVWLPCHHASLPTAMLTLSLQWEEVNAPLLNLGAQELKDELWYQFFCQRKLIHVLVWWEKDQY